MKEKISKVNLKGKEVKEMKKVIFMLLLTALFIIGVSIQAHALTITSGEYRFVVAEAYTNIVDPGNPVVAGQAFQGNQWAIARINEVQKLNSGTGLYDSIWSPGQLVPEPPTGTSDRYLTAVFGGLSYQVDPAATANGVAVAPNTGLGYNVRQHALAPATAPANPSGSGLSHPNDYVTDAIGLKVFPEAVYFSDAAGQTGYLKVYSNATNIFNLDVAAGIGLGGGAFGTFGTNIISGTLLMDGVFDLMALARQDGTATLFDIFGNPLDPDSRNSLGQYASLRSIGTSDTETGVNGFLQLTGAGYWDTLLDSNSPNLFGADARVDFTARALIGSPYLPPGPGQTAAPQSAFGWDFIDVGQAITQAVPEPSTLLLLGIGLLGLGISRRKYF